jgi:hypothetical protein
MQNKQLDGLEESKRISESFLNKVNEHSKDFESVQETFGSKVIEDLCIAVNYHTDMIEEYKHGFKLLLDALESANKVIHKLDDRISALEREIKK